MQIDRSNYEIWFIDWLDGNLSDPQLEMLKLFLGNNPDLREEFNDLAPVNLVSSTISFPQKEQLLKSPSHIPLSQFEYLCAAYLENDLTPGQQTELLQIVSRYPDKKTTFDLIQKTILTREKTEYKYKSLLRKPVKIQKIIRLTVAGLSTAAAIYLLISIFSTHGPALRVNNTAQTPASDTTIKSPSSMSAAGTTVIERIPVMSHKESEEKFCDNKKGNTIARSRMTDTPYDSQGRITDNQKITINKVTVRPQIDLTAGVISNSLMASNPPAPPHVQDERSKVGRYISKTFREKLLREKTPPDSPLKGYEIAEAGVTGLNKLLGWQMVLDRKNDGYGQPGSVYFSSKLLKVNTPVKKREVQP